MSTQNAGHALPSNKEQWGRDVVDAKINADTPFHMCRMESASKVELKDWLRLKVLWVTHTQQQPNHKRVFGEDKDLRPLAKLEEDSKLALEKMPWYAALAKTDRDPKTWMGLADWKESTLALERRLRTLELLQHDRMGPREALDDQDLFKMHVEPQPYPQRVTRSATLAGQKVPAERSSEDESSCDNAGNSHSSAGSSSNKYSGSKEGYASFPSSVQRTLDTLVRTRPIGEEEVNTSFLSLLRALCIYDPQLYKNIRWSPYRKAFSVNQPDEHGRPTKIITAATDGCLQLLRDDALDEDCTTLAIVEVKARSRDKNTSRLIQMQEGAEMAAWISSQHMSGHLPMRTGDSNYRYVCFYTSADLGSTLSIFLLLFS